VVFDVLFVDPSPDPSVDEEFVQAMRKVPTVLGAASALSQRPTRNGSFLLEELIRPHEAFYKAAAGIGIVGLPDSDGVVNRFLVDRSELFPDIPPLAEAAVGLGAQSARPTNRDLLNFYGPSQTIPTVSYEAALETSPGLPADTFKDKVVFVGLVLRGHTGPAQREAFPSPYGDLIFGTELHASMAANLKDQTWVRRLSSRMELAVGVALCFLTAFMILMLKSRRLLFLLGGSAVVCFLGQYLAFRSLMFIPMWGALLVGLAAGLILRLALDHLAPAPRKRKLGSPP
jgi:CHASE2 domain-containing sensor protein